MNIQINYKKTLKIKGNSNYIIFTDEKFNINSFKNTLSKSELSFISELLKNSDTKKDFLDFQVTAKKKIILVSLNEKLPFSKIENLGAKFYHHIKDNKINEYILDTNFILFKNKNIVGHFFHGIKLLNFHRL